MVALKVLMAPSGSCGADFSRALEVEVQVMREARHPHIVTCFGLCVQVGRIYTEMPML